MSRPDALVGWLSRGAALVSAAVFSIAVVLLGGCGSTGTPAPVDSWDGSGPVPAGYYHVREGDTLLSISRRHKLDYRKIARWNGIGPPYRIYAGRLIQVVPPDHRAAPVTSSAGSAGSGGSAAGVSKVRKPSSSGSRTVTTAPKTVKTTSKTAKTARTGKTASQGSTKTASAAKGSGVKWRWPLSGKVTQTYRRGDRTRQGIRIRARAGQLVKAAGAGSVVYSGSGLKGYGNLIIVKHNKNYLSAYGFNRRLLVNEGDRVKVGQDLAEVGQASDGAHILHFEIRRNGSAVDPLRYLPRSH